MSYGLSCVVSDIPANRNVALDEERFFPPGDIKALSEKILKFANSPMREDEKQKQIEMIAEKYNWDTIAEQTLAVYKKVLE